MNTTSLSELYKSCFISSILCLQPSGKNHKFLNQSWTWTLALIFYGLVQVYWGVMIEPTTLVITIMEVYYKNANFSEIAVP